MIDILVTGGAGYIGSHFLHFLINSNSNINYRVTVIDNLMSGNFEALPKSPQIELHKTSLLDEAGLERIFNERNFQATVHFAALTRADESVYKPDDYYEVNLKGTLNLLNLHKKFNVPNFIFSSTAAVYGEPHYLPIDENHPIAPLNPYGRSKYMAELCLRDYTEAFNLKAIVFRYFNVGGAHPRGIVGAYCRNKGNLIPEIFKSIREKRQLSVFENNDPKTDGSGIRDYIHVMDLAQAHFLGLEKLLNQNSCKFEIFNLGTESGYSVKETLNEVEKVTGKKVSWQTAPQRIGDPAVSVASSKKAQAVLGWKTEYNLTDIIEHSWKWEEKQLSLSL